MNGHIIRAKKKEGKTKQNRRENKSYALHRQDTHQEWLDVCDRDVTIRGI